MTDFKDRERGEEAKFAFDEETDAYKKAVVQADFEEAGDEDVIRKLLGDLTAADCDVSESDIRTKLEECAVEARRQFMSDGA